MILVYIFQKTEQYYIRFTITSNNDMHAKQKKTKKKTIVEQHKLNTTYYKQNNKLRDHIYEHAKRIN